MIHKNMVFAKKKKQLWDLKREIIKGVNKRRKPGDYMGSDKKSIQLPNFW